MTAAATTTTTTLLTQPPAVVFQIQRGGDGSQNSATPLTVKLKPSDSALEYAITVCHEDKSLGVTGAIVQFNFTPFQRAVPYSRSDDTSTAQVLATLVAPQQMFRMELVPPYIVVHVTRKHLPVSTHHNDAAARLAFELKRKDGGSDFVYTQPFLVASKQPKVPTVHSQPKRLRGLPPTAMRPVTTLSRAPRSIDVKLAAVAAEAEAKPKSEAEAEAEVNDEAEGAEAKTRTRPRLPRLAKFMSDQRTNQRKRLRTTPAAFTTTQEAFTTLTTPATFTTRTDGTETSVLPFDVDITPLPTDDTGWSVWNLGTACMSDFFH